MKTTYNYIIHGVPAITPKNRASCFSAFEKQRILNIRYKRDLEEQHANRPLLTGYLIFLAKFYFPPQHPIEPRENKPHHQKPDCLRLLEFIDRIALGILYDNHSTIIKFEGEKLYSLKPRTEIILIEERKK